MTEENIKEKNICTHCGDSDHKWHEVYYGDCVTLKKIDKTYIAWCEIMNNYVLISKND